MRQKETKEMMGYWLEMFWRAGNQPASLRNSQFSPLWPERSDIEPARCRSHLGNMLILERQGSDISYRLAGTGLCSLFGRELKRETYSRSFVREDQKSIENWVDRIGLDDHLVLLCTIGESERGERINLETLLMPLNHNGRRGNRILGITTPCDRPYWLGVRPVLKQSIRSVRILRPWDHASGRFGEKPVTPTALSLRKRLAEVESPPLFHTSAPLPGDDIAQNLPVSGRRVSHLTVFDGGKS